MKRKLLLSTFITIMALPVWADVEVNETNFPDEHFRSWIQQKPYGQDNLLTDAEIAEIQTIDVSRQSIQSLQGIEFFTELTKLDCYSSMLTSLDVSKNTKLTNLSCHRNMISSLNVEGCTMLVYIDCSNNKLTSLDLRSNVALNSLHCSYNVLKSLDVSQNTKLSSIGCAHNRLASISISQNTGVSFIECESNSIRGAAMDSLIANLRTVTNGQLHAINYHREGNVMTPEQVAAAKEKGWTPYYRPAKEASWQPYEGGYPAVGLEINEQNFPDANFREILENDIESGFDGVFTEEEIAQMQTLSVNNKIIQTLEGVQYFTALTALSCSGNHLTTLDLSKNISLTEVYCMGNNINGAGLDSLIASLPSVSEGRLYFIYTGEQEEHNVMTKSQATAARAKNWVPYSVYYRPEDYYYEVQEYDGIDDTNVKRIHTTNSSDGLDEIQYYNLKGIRSTQKNKGINIIRRSDGSVQKIIK